MRISDWSSDVCSSDLPMTLSFPDLAPDGRIVLLTGAGISKESGLDTFRDPDGVWARHRIEDVATHDAFRREPAPVHAYYNIRRRTLPAPSIRPNAAQPPPARPQRDSPRTFHTSPHT